MTMRFLGLLTVLSGLTGLAHAQTASAPATVVAASPTTPASPVDDGSTAAYKAVDAKTRQALAAIPATGDIEVDFLRMVMPYQKAISDLATAALKYSSDADIRMMAGDMVKQQEADLRKVREWLRLHGPLDALELPQTTSASTLPLAGKPASPKKTITMTEFLDISRTVPVVSGTAPASPILPPVTATSPTQTPVNSVSSTVTSATAPVSATTELMPDGLPASLTPAMPAHDAEIINTAPQMEFLDAKP